MAGREDLINQLAASMGAGAFAKTKYEESRFDAETGTLYCRGMAISKSTAERAVQHFELLEKKCDINDPNQRNMAMIYRCAIESIKMIQDPKVIEFLQKEGRKQDLNAQIIK
ncbi:hypothetical protein bpr_II050 (plasmid) [Butyrivibrio proteoclasticus B316]|uniref:Uncharacterized protein n=1 Tax=Butyrivibrio proteoclasticus (strain ATCC 51982 / DSM 14932 / B316) TaxID=515622 RepID=E0S3K8_BUTPB|nr:hypothetical protein [Butyrivibrio proteoclasticus]ADL35990.1 hypothetical protein bpr_II050 [Butyrivibrio proteoclasticus B316]